MEDWLTYRLSDLILFSPRTYYRMFELYHQDAWPAQLAAVALAVVIFILLRRGDAWGGPTIAGLLVACWVWVAFAFHVGRYATINPAAQYFAAAFMVQALLLFWGGVVRKRLTFSRWDEGAARFSPGLFLLAVALPPLAGRAAGRTWEQVELMGLTPDATAVATIAVLLLSSRPAPRALMVVPLAWCVIGGATLWALESAEAWVLILAGVATLAALVRGSPFSGKSVRV
jgi:hypothetical protein